MNKNNIFPMLVSSCPEGKARGGNEKYISIEIEHTIKY